MDVLGAGGGGGAGFAVCVCGLSKELFFGCGAVLSCRCDCCRVFKHVMGVCCKGGVSLLVLVFASGWGSAGGCVLEDCGVRECRALL